MRRLPVPVVLAAAAVFGGASGAQAHPHVWVTTETTVLYENGTIVGLRHKWSFDDFYTSMAVQGLDANNDGIYDRNELAELAKVNLEGLKEFDFFTNFMLASTKLKFGAPRDYWLEHTEAAASQSQVVEMTDAEMDKQIAAEEARGKAAREQPPAPGMFARLWNWFFGAPSDTRQASAKDSAKTAPPSKVLSLNFTLPLEQPVLAEAQGLSFTIGDPSFFIAFEPAAKNAVVLGPGAPASCKIQVGAAAPAGEAAPPEAAVPATPGANPAAEATPTEPNPAADLSRLGDAFAQQFGSSVLGKPVSISCGPRS